LAGLPPRWDLTVTNPTAVGLPLQWERIAASLHDSAAAEYEPAPFGLPTARQAVANLHGNQLPWSQVVLSASTSEAYAWLFQLLCDPGDEVLVPVPSYPLFEVLAGLAGVKLVAVPCPFADGWYLDLHALERAVTARTKAIVVVQPNNPTGAVISEGEADALQGLCARHGVALMADEVFADWLAPGVAFHSLAGVSRCLTFVLGGLSKACLLPQLKLAWTLVSGPRGLVDDALARLEQIADAFLNVAAPVQHALPALIDLRADIQAPLRTRLTKNRALAADLCAGSQVSLVPSQGGWALVFRVPATRSDDEWVELLLREAGVLVQPGWFYDFAGNGWLVGSALVEETVLRKGVAALVSGIDS
jgi:aspartate/methionine/tyrosine aminotransferase